MKEFWPGLCECGCGEVAPLAVKTSARDGYVKGEPISFVKGHNSRVRSEETKEKLRVASSGRSHSAETRAKIGASKIGVSLLGTRGANHYRWRGDDASYNAMHTWLSTYHPKTSICEECGVGGVRTHYAFQHHGQPYTRDRNDYRELCSLCHVRFDRGKL